MHEHKKKHLGTGGAGKQVVMGILRRTDATAKSKVTASHVPDTRRVTLHEQVRRHIEPGSKLYTDAWVGYRGLAGEYDHEIIDHVISYVEGSIHTNGIENFWSLLKRTIKGTYVSVEPFHLGRYLDEQAWRFNELNGSVRWYPRSLENGSPTRS